MNIGFIVSNSLHNGGAERVIANLSNKFIHDNKVIIITPNQDENDYYVDTRILRYYYNDGIKVTTPRYLRAFKRILYIRSICNREQLDVLIGFIPGAVSYAMLSTLGIKTKSIVSERNDPNTTYPTMIRRIKGKLDFLLSDFAVFQTPDAKGWFPKPVQKKSEIVYNPVADVFYNTKRKPICNRFVTCGRLVAQKNHKMLIEAFGIAHQTHPDICLDIYGEGQLHCELESCISANNLEGIVRLCGSTANVPKVLSEAAFFILSSDFEGAPNALMEAMAMGIPSISTDCPCGGPKMLLGHEENGILVPVNDKQVMVDAICRLVDDKQLSNRFSQAGKRKAQEFNSDSIKKHWLRIIHKVVSE